jgi:hypothetical protein
VTRLQLEISLRFLAMIWSCQRTKLIAGHCCGYKLLSLAFQFITCACIIVVSGSGQDAKLPMVVVRKRNDWTHCLYCKCQLGFLSVFGCLNHCSCMKWFKIIRILLFGWVNCTNSFMMK